MDALKNVPFTTQALAVGLVYFLYFATSLAALICLAIVWDRQWPVDFAVATIVATSSLHFLLFALGYLLAPGYQPYPVQPRWAFLLADGVQACALGVATGVYIADPYTRAAPMAATIVTMAAQLLCFYKTFTLVTDVRAGRRDDRTGEKLSM